MWVLRKTAGEAASFHGWTSKAHLKAGACGATQRALWVSLQCRHGEGLFLRFCLSTARQHFPEGFVKPWIARQSLEREYAQSDTMEYPFSFVLDSPVWKFAWMLATWVGSAPTVVSGCFRCIFIVAREGESGWNRCSCLHDLRERRTGVVYSWYCTEFTWTRR